MTNPSISAINATQSAMQSAAHSELLVRDPSSLPWVPWAMTGAQFKLMSADPENGRFSLMIRLERGCMAPRHRHVGAVEGLVLEGSFHYDDNPEQRYTAGMYLLERAGAVHTPVSPVGALMFAVFHGPVEGLDNEGRVTGRVGCEWHIKAWNAALAAVSHQS